MWALTVRKVVGLFPFLHGLVFCLLRLIESQDYFLLARDVMYIDKFHTYVLSACSAAMIARSTFFREAVTHRPSYMTSRDRDVSS